METRDPTGKENAGTRKKNLTFLKQRVYMLERRKTDTVVESNFSGDHGSSGTLRRSQSDRSEYSQKLQEKMAPQAGSSGLVGSPLETEEQLKRRMMAKRQKIIAEMIQTEKDYLNDLELCIRTVVEPLRRRQIARLDVDGLFSNIESVYHISTKLLSALEEATANVEPAMQVIGMFTHNHGAIHEFIPCQREHSYTLKMQELKSIPEICLYR
uniref:Rho guanine nucleotide exchange factor 38 n=1 Tax=Varanus komodoensis TaxID=61221 RepID=A0A8D2KZQ6_VARKO